MMSTKIEKDCSTVRQWITGIIANLTILVYGLQAGWMSPSIPVLQSDKSPSGYPLTDFDISLIASNVVFTAAIASIPFSVLVDKFGRKIGILLVSSLQIVGFTLKILSAHPYSLIASQGLSGIACGGIFIVVPMYNKEISADAVKGTLTALGLLCHGCGMLIMYALGAYLDYFSVLYAVIWIPILNFLFLLRIPESPAFLIKKRRIEEATATVAYLNGLDCDDKLVQSIISIMVNDQAHFDALPKANFKTIFTYKTTRKAFWLTTLLISVADFGGNFSIMAYASVIIRNSGVTIAPHLQAMSFPAVMLLGSLLSILTVEKYGRRPLLMTCQFLNGVPMIIIGTILLLQRFQITVPSWISIICIIICTFSYGAGILPVPIIVISEVFNFEVRAMVTGLLYTYGGFINVSQSFSFMNLSNLLGMYSMFYFFGTFNLVCLLLCNLFMPETKGKSLEEIQKLL